MKPTRTAQVALLLAALVALGATVAQAQSGLPVGAGLRGRVLDARSGEPLEDATVSLELIPGGILSGRGPGTPGLLATARQRRTAADGAYAFEGLAPGTYRVRVVRFGYRSASLDVHYDGPADSRISVGLEVEPVELEPMEVVGHRPEALGTDRRVAPTRSEDDRVALERLRQARYLTPDARVVTDGDMVEAVTLGETDLLRALHHLPGVAAADDWSAEPWTRGARWDETRIYFDDLPLFDPMHMGGAFTAVSPDAIGAMTFHPGVRPVGAGDAGAGVVDLRSRRATGEERLEALGQLGVVSARFSVDRPYGQGSGITFGGRRSMLEDISELAGDRGDFRHLPYRFTDLSGRWDQVLGDSVKVEVSGLRNRDQVLGDLPGELKGARGSWGNTALRATLESTRFGVRTRLTEGGSTFASDIDLVPFDATSLELLDAKTAAPTFNRVRTRITQLTVSPRSRTGAMPPWTLGVRRTRTRVEYRGPAPWPYPDAANAGTLEEESSVDRYAYWGRLRKEILPDVEASLGLQLEAGGLPDASGDGLTASPRLAVAWTPQNALRVSAAVGRHYQYEQALAAAGFSIGPELTPGHLWVSSRGRIPAIRADIATLGAEIWLPGGWLAAANTYIRASEGGLTPSPDSGYVRARPAIIESELAAGWVAATSRSVGLELSARKLSGRWTGSVAYSLSRGRTTAEGQQFTTPGGRTHLLDAALVMRTSAHTRFGAALTAASGAAYTRFYAFRCSVAAWYCPAVDDGGTPLVGFAEPAGAERTPIYVSLDLHVERGGTVFGLPVGVYAQLRNALARDNRAAYVGSILDCGADGASCTLTDRFEDGFPLLPLVGIWIRM